ncbi:hypothetical protein HY68_31360 [Streptomyces sp. AcH 505]|uniref:acyl-CoA carboxylase subunit epsilon n=1 Tax=Streptomyces sp. AcH 505 TaxID=352211 RepID=UPI000591DD43|nr:hypothetical protein HY68_31360 [Streptomyces sp. AcH 505]
MSETVEETLWKIVCGSPNPEELAAVTAVLASLARRAEAPATPVVVPLAGWRHSVTPRLGGSWRAAA